MPSIQAHTHHLTLAISASHYSLLRSAHHWVGRLAFGVEATASSLQLVERGEKMVRSALQLGDTRNLRLRLLAKGEAAIGKMSIGVVVSHPSVTCCV